MKLLLHRGKSEISCSRIASASPVLDLGHVDPAGPDSGTILDAARRMLGTPGRTDGAPLSLEVALDNLIAQLLKDPERVRRPLE